MRVARACDPRARSRLTRERRALATAPRKTTPTKPRSEVPNLSSEKIVCHLGRTLLSFGEVQTYILITITRNPKIFEFPGMSDERCDVVIAVLQRDRIRGCATSRHALWTVTPPPPSTRVTDTPRAFESDSRRDGGELLRPRPPRRRGSRGTNEKTNRLGAAGFRLGTPRPSTARPLRVISR